MKGASVSDSQGRQGPPGFDPDFSSVRQWAEMYRSVGLQVVPGLEVRAGQQWKRPAHAWAEFQNELANQNVFDKWFPRNLMLPQMGVIAGAASGGLMVIDLDFQKIPQAWDWYRRVLDVHNNGLDLETWIQTTGGGGKQLFFECPEGFIPPTNKTAIGVDIRGQGGFAMMPPSRHESGGFYQWDRGLAPWEVPLGIAPGWLCEEVTKVAGEAQARAVVDAMAPSMHLAYPLPNANPFDTLRRDGREEYMRDVVCAAIADLRAQGVVPDDKEMHEAFARYLAQVGPKNPAEDINKLQALEREGRGLSAFTQKWRALLRNEAKIEKFAADRPTALAQASEPYVAQPLDTRISPYTPIDPSTIQPRDWLYGTHYNRQYVSVTVAQGGLGKSSMTIVEALSMVSGQPLLGVQPPRRLRVWMFNGEDAYVDLQRRIEAARKHYRLRKEDLEGLYINSGRELPLILARRVSKNGIEIVEPLVDELIAAITAMRIDVVIVDPFISTHHISENANEEVDQVVKTWARIADYTACAVEIVHHVRKTNGSEATVEDGRGASALLAAARSARVLNRASEQDADRLNKRDARKRIFKVDDGKANLAPLAEHAEFFEMVSVDLGNSRPPEPGEMFGTDSDKVGVCTRLEMPAVFDDMPSADVAEKILRKINSGFYNYGSGIEKDNERNAITLAADMGGVNYERAKGWLHAWKRMGTLYEDKAYYEPRKRSIDVLRWDPEGRKGGKNEE